MNTRLAALIAVILLCCGNFTYAATPTEADAKPAQPDADDIKQAQLLQAGVQLVRMKRSGEAITGYFDKVIAFYKAKYSDETTNYYCGRHLAESLMYLLQAAEEKKNGVVINCNWATALYVKAYALIDLGKVEDAKAALRAAIAQSPRNAQYLSEFAHILALEKNWGESLKGFQAAVAAAKEFSPPEIKKFELGRARRGVGYAYIELGQLDKAEETYKLCLQEDPSDRMAQAQLVYVLDQRRKQSPTESRPQ